MTIKQYCRYKGIMCSRATEFGYCNLTACINRGVNHEAQVTLDDISTAYENGYKQGKFEAQRWIPCSERLPKAGEYIGDVGKYYLAQNEYGDMLVARYTHGEYWEQIYQLKPIGDDIVAWMPLPEPYKENES